MTNEKKYYDNSGAAFPTSAVYTENHGLIYGNDGLTMRDYFAGKALQGMLANPDISKRILKNENDAIKNQEWHCRVAYQFAEEMIETRKSEHKSES